MKVGDLVMSRKGNICLILRIEKVEGNSRYLASHFCDVQWLSTGIVRTGLAKHHLGKVISESR